MLTPFYNQEINEVPLPILERWLARVNERRAAGRRFLDHQIEVIEAVEARIKRENEADPTPYCGNCKAMTWDLCRCGPIAEND